MKTVNAITMIALGVAAMLLLLFVLGCSAPMVQTTDVVTVEVENVNIIILLESGNETN